MGVSQPYPFPRTNSSKINSPRANEMSLWWSLSPHILFVRDACFPTLSREYFPANTTADKELQKHSHHGKCCSPPKGKGYLRVAAVGVLHLNSPSHERFFEAGIARGYASKRRPRATRKTQEAGDLHRMLTEAAEMRQANPMRTLCQEGGAGEVYAVLADPFSDTQRRRK